MVDLSLLQSISYMAGALGVCMAAVYYVYNMRAAEKDRRKQIILQKLPAVTREYYEWNLQIRNNWKGPEEWDTKYRLDPELESKVWYIMNIYNVVGQLYVERMMSLEQVALLYAPGWVISWYEMFEFYIRRLRFNSRGEPIQPMMYAPFERLYSDMKDRYPGVAQEQRMMREEVEELRRRQETGLDSKASPP